ncbi:MAG TPA: TorF family putative porin [Caulobacteraceae bacterium]|nr:TorF family putative porin [Caulobacteraceae bacterium]
MAAAFCHGASARAQAVFSVAGDSDYRLRGVSLSGGRPALSLALAYDHSSGVYGAASAVFADGGPGGARLLGYQLDLGYARRAGRDGSWEVGVTDARFSDPVDGAHDYVEIYGGVTRKGLSARLYYSPDYFGEHVSTLYLDVGGAVRLRRHWRAFAHGGVLTPISGRSYPNSRKQHYDLRAGVAFDYQSLELRLAWSTVLPGPDYPIGYDQSRQAVVVGAAIGF